MSFKRFVLIEPVQGGAQQVESSMNFLMWKKVFGADKKPITDQRESYGGNVWRIVADADEAKELSIVNSGPAIPSSIPIPKLPPEALKEVAAAPLPALPDLDPAGKPVDVKDPIASPVVKNKPGRPAKATA